MGVNDRQIVVKDEGGDVRGESIATAVAITPGMLIERASATTVQAHNSAGENAQRMFALGDEMQGKEIDTAYAASALIQHSILGRGCVVNALLANGESVTAGVTFVESNGDGYLKAHAASSAGAVEYPEAIVGLALETLDMSDSSGADPSSQRFLVEIV